MDKKLAKKLLYATPTIEYFPSGTGATFLELLFKSDDPYGNRENRELVIMLGGLLQAEARRVLRQKGGKK